MSNRPYSSEEIDFTAEEMAAVGAVALQSSCLDQTLLFILEELAGADVLSAAAIRILSNRSSPSQKRTQILTLCNELYFLDSEFVAEMKSLMKRVYKHTKQRNVLSHSVPSSGIDDAATFVEYYFNPESGAEHRIHRLTAKEINRYAKNLYNLNCDCKGMLSRIREKREDLRDTLRKMQKQ